MDNITNVIVDNIIDYSSDFDKVVDKVDILIDLLKQLIALNMLFVTVIVSTFIILLFYNVLKKFMY